MIWHRLKRLFHGGRGDRGGPEASEIGCHEALERINEFLDGELDPADAPAVEAHFQVCSRCYPHLKLERGFRSRVQSALAQPEVPQELRDRVLGILEDQGDPDHS